MHVLLILFITRYLLTVSQDVHTKYDEQVRQDILQA